MYLDMTNSIFSKFERNELNKITVKSILEKLTSCSTGDKQSILKGNLN